MQCYVVFVLVLRDYNYLEIIEPQVSLHATLIEPQVSLHAHCMPLSAYAKKTISGAVQSMQAA